MIKNIWIAMKKIPMVMKKKTVKKKKTIPWWKTAKVDKAINGEVAQGGVAARADKE